MAAPSVGDTVDITWNDGRHAGTVEQIAVGTVRMRISGPPDVTIVVAATHLREAGPKHWRLEL